jgi:type VI secretion system protein VasI
VNIPFMARYLAAALLLLAGNTFGQSDTSAPGLDLGSRLEEASRIEDPKARLEAYDAIVSDYELATQDLIPVGVSKWIDSSLTDPMDDSKTVVLMLDADSGDDSSGRPVSLIFRYDGHGSELYINWNVPVAAGSRVTIRVGYAPAETAEWTVSTDGKATFYPRNPVELIRRLQDADSFMARVTPPAGRPVLAVFDVRGLSSILSKYAADLHLQ